MKRIEIANKLRCNYWSFDASLKTLQNKSLIELDENKYKIYDSIFKEWLKKNMKKKEIIPIKK